MDDEVKKSRVAVPVWLIITLTAVVAAAIAGLSVALLVGSDGDLGSDTAVLTSAVIEASSSMPTSLLPSTTSAPTTTVGISPETELKKMVTGFGSEAVSSLATGECPLTAAVVTENQLKLFEWVGDEWGEISFDLFDNFDTPILEATAGDFTPNAGHEAFIVQFDGPAIGGPPFGGILGQYECRWGLVDIVRDDSVGKVAIGLDYSPDFGLTGFSRTSSEYADMHLTYDPHNVAFFVEWLDDGQPIGD